MNSSGTPKSRLNSEASSSSHSREALSPLPPNPSSTLLPKIRSSPTRSSAANNNNNTNRQKSTAPPSGRNATVAENDDAAAPPLDDSLTAQTMHALLQPSTHPPLSWTARQAKEKRRRDMLQLQRWVQVETERFSRGGCEPAPTKHQSHTALNELSSLLRSGQKICEHAISQLTQHITAGTSGGDDIAAEILVDVWQVAANIAGQQQSSLRADGATARQQAQQAEETASVLQTQLQQLQKDALDASQRVRDPLTNGIGQENSNLTRREGGSGGGGAHRSGSSTGDDGTCPSFSAREYTEAVAAATLDLKNENAKLAAALERCKRDLAAVSQRADALEDQASTAAQAQSRAETTAAEVKELRGLMGQMTPRPQPQHHPLHALLQEESKVALVLAALQEHPLMPLEDLVAMLVNPIPTDTTTSSNTSAPASVAAAVVDSAEKITPISETTSAAAAAITTVNTVSSTESIHIPASNATTNRFAGALVGVPPTALTDVLLHARGSTAQRFNFLELVAAKLRVDYSSLSAELENYRETDRRREAARRRREEEAQLEKKNAVQQYLDLLTSQGEDAWKEQLIGMGQGQEVPKLFRHSGKIRNKHMSKRDTEKLVKELWKERLVDPAVSAGRAGELVDFVGAYLQKKVGIAAAVIDLGYNFLYGLWLFQWDADCELFLKILTGEIREEVYVAQARLQSDLEDLFAALDKAKGQITGSIPKEDLRTALWSFFRVGQPGGKTLARFDEVMQALDTDQPENNTIWKKIFEEDREFNQGEFAECLRDQFLQERIEFFTALETALYEESGNEDECTKAQVVQAILAVDPERSEKAAAAAVGSVFFPGTDTLSIKVVMKKLSKGMLQVGSIMEDRGSTSIRPSGKNSVSSGKMSIMGGKGRASHMTAGGAAAGKSGLLATAKKQNEAVGRALEAVRLDWIQKQLGQEKKGGGGGGGGDVSEDGGGGDAGAQQSHAADGGGGS